MAESMYSYWVARKKAYVDAGQLPAADIDFKISQHEKIMNDLLDHIVAIELLQDDR